MEATKGQKKILKTEIELFIINRVRQLREERNVGQKKLALELKLASSFIGNTEDPYNKAKYNLNHLNEIARFFNVPYSYFFPETHLEKDCVEEYLDIHPRLRSNYDKMAKNHEEEDRKKIDERQKIKKKKATTKAKTKKK